ncbi:hypothetical protein [Streptomyces sp. NPDC015131]|uniref:hypothetical protein n=1 Tax=Streptomyces sp. NPDC015131 TaxID=3364941 RepID=UPI0036FA0A03
MFAATCVLLTGAGHLLMSGSPVPWWALGAGFAVTAGAAWSFAGRERGLPAVTGLAVTAQAVLHAGFSLAQVVILPAAPGDGTSLVRRWAGQVLCGAGHVGTSGGAPHGMVPSHPHGHARHAAVAWTPAAGAPAGHDPAAVAPEAVASAAMSPGGMLAAHLLAALLCGVWLAYGERAAFRLLRAVAARLAAPLRLALWPSWLPGVPRPRVRRRHTAVTPRRLLLATSCVTRGPPSGSAVVRQPAPRGLAA